MAIAPKAIVKPESTVESTVESTIVRIKNAHTGAIFLEDGERLEADGEAEVSKEMADLLHNFVKVV